MALVKSTLAEKIKNALDANSDTEVDPAQAREQTANDIADAIDSYIKAGVVTVDPSSHTGTIT
jgi:hypothetical protein